MLRKARLAERVLFNRAKDSKASGAIGRGLRDLGAGLKQGTFHPVTVGAGFAGMGAFGGTIGADLVRSGYQDLESALGLRASPQEERLGQYRRVAGFRSQIQDKVSQAERLKKQAIAQIARENPHMLAELMAGQMLPQGAIVIGGGQRMDLLNKLAGAMAQDAMSEVRF